MDADSIIPIGTRIGNYELTGVLGQGGMGTVYAAVHVGLGKQVAIKTLRAELASDPSLHTRFVREGKAAAAVRHPNVVDVDDVGVFENTPYLVMEYLEGEDLGNLIRRCGRLSVQQTADIMLPVLLAIAQAHRAGVIHRDLKPDNVFLAGAFGTRAPVPKVLDFGISKLRETQSLGMTGENAMLGTPYYMSPEQAASSRDVDARSDLYSLGVLLYHCVSGRVPFDGSSLAQVIGQIMHAQPRPLRESIPEVPERFERIVLQLMAKDPGRRPQHALDVAQLLLPYAGPRVQINCAPELGLAQGETLPGTPYVEQGQGPSTLSPSSHTVRTEQPSTSRRWALLLLTAAALSGLWLWLRGSPPPSGDFRAGAAHRDTQPTAAEVPPLSTPSVADPLPTREVAPPLVPVQTTPPPAKVPIEPVPPATRADAGAAVELRPGKRPRPQRAQAGKTPKAKTASAEGPAAQPSASGDDIWGSRR